MDSKIERLAQAGFALHWLHPKSKRPIGNEWAAKPVFSHKELMKAYRDGNNVGVRLGKWSVIEGLFLHIIDMDIRVADQAESALEKLAELLPEIDINYVPTVISGSGGASRHFYILTDKPFPPKKFAHSDGFAMVWDESKKRDVKKWDWELHLLGTGAQAAIPPSIHPDTGKPYRWLREFDFNLAELGILPSIPSQALARVSDDRPETNDTERQQPVGLSDEEIISVLDELPVDEWFEDRDQWMRVGMALHHETDGSDFGFTTWCEYSRLSDKFDEKDQKRVWRSFKNRAAAPFRFASLLAVVREQRALAMYDDLDDFDDLGEPTADDADLALIDSVMVEPAKKPGKAAIKLAKQEVEFALGADAPKWVARLNKKHAVVRVSGKTVIMDFELDGRVTYGSVGDLHNFYENDRRPKDDTTVPITKLWMQSKHRRQYPNGIVFAPQGGPEGAYNHWQGFSVEPDGSKSCRLFLKHLRDIFCDGNDEHYEYMIGYWAHMIQKPWEKPGVAVVAKGRKGAGKDTVAEYVGELIKLHYITIANKDQFVGKFNAHQEKCLLLHVQEGFWAGDKRDEGPLKYLITSPSVMIEPKGMNAFPITSILRVFISSNERWVVPATEDERRYFVVNVSNKQRGNHKYFEALRKEMDGDGPAALLDYLTNYDISDFQVRDVPDTEALAEQKVEGLKNVERWWHGVLQHGSIEGHGHAQNANSISNNQWLRESVRIEKSEFRDGYSRWMRNRRYDGEEISEIEFTKRMMHMLPGITQARPRAGSGRIHMYVLPDLNECRTSFEQMLGSELTWPEDQMKTEIIEEIDDL